MAPDNMYLDYTDGCGVISVKNRNLFATIAPKLGGQVIGLRHIPSDIEILRRPQSLDDWRTQPFLYGIPILFPPGRIRNGRFFAAGKTYQWPINDPVGPHHLHGFAAIREWQIIELSPDLGIVTLAMEDHRKTNPLGSSFRFVQSYQLDNASLTLAAHIKNLGPQPMPLGVGYHTNLNLDLERDGRDYAIWIPPGDEWEMDADAIPIGRRTSLHHLANLTNGTSLLSLISDHGYRVDAKSVNEIRLQALPRGPEIRLQPSEKFQHWVIYRPEETPVASVEPVTWVDNAPNLPLPRDETGFVLLQPSDEAHYRFTIHITMPNVES